MKAIPKTLSWKVLAALLALALTAAACGSDAETTTTEAEVENSESATDADDGDEPTAEDDGDEPTAEDDGDEPTEDATSSTGELEIFSWWTSGSEDTALQALISAFQAGAPNADIINGAVSGGGGANAQAVLATRIQGNDLPDTWQSGPGGRLTPYLEADVIRPVTEVYDDAGFRDTMPAGLIESLSVDGEIYAVATGAHRGNNLWYNKALLDGAGVDAPAGDYTNEQFLADLATLDAAGVTGLCLGANQAFAVDELFENILLGVVGPEGWAALRDGDRSWDDPEVREAAEIFGQVLDYVDPDASALTWDQAILRLADGTCAFNSMGDWAYGELINSGAVDNEDFGYVNQPGTDGVFMLVVDAFVVAKDTPNWDLAKVWLTEMGQPETQLEFNIAKGASPVRNDVDTSALPPYQQGAADALAADATALSIVHHGEPAFQTVMSEAVTIFAQTKDVEQFVQALASA